MDEGGGNEIRSILPLFVIRHDWRGAGTGMSWQPPRAPARPLTGAERNRRRWRERHNVVHVQGIDVPVQVIAALIELGYFCTCFSTTKLATRRVTGQRPTKMPHRSA